MRKIIVLSMITLDGVMQSPGSPKEDTSGGFKYGGWVEPFGDDVSNEILQRQLKPAEYLLGRKTFDIWEPYWPTHGDFWPAINENKKYILSATKEKSDWSNTVFIKSVEDIKKLKNSNGADLQVHGSGELVQLLLKN